MAALLEKPDYRPVIEVGGDKDELRDPEMDLAKMRAVWSRENLDTDQMAGLIVGGTTSKVPLAQRTETVQLSEN